MNQCPLIVDLDGTLVHTDTLHELLTASIFRNPFNLFSILGWLGRGKAGFKEALVSHQPLDVSCLPWNLELIDWLTVEKNSGREIVLCTGANQVIAGAVEEHLGLFSDVIASDGSRNMTGHAKADLLAERFGEGQFDYVGNADVDLAIWQKARKAILTNAPGNLRRKAEALSEIDREFPRRRVGVRDLVRVLRLHQWAKNLLLFVPVIASHNLGQPGDWLDMLVAFLAFSLCASSVYIINDLHDLDSDRHHARKCRRPFAAGKVPLRWGWLLGPVLLLLALLGGALVNQAFLSVLCIYFLLTLAYSLWLKSLVLVDCLVLSLLYTLRIIAGAQMVGHDLSFWLMAFAVFLFLSLSFVKRYSELADLQQSGKASARGRGYDISDISLIHTMGITAGYASVLVLALYLNSEEVMELYRNPQIIWGAVPVILFWVSWMWLQAHRGNMHDDPLIFALKDTVSLVCGVVFLAMVAGGTLVWPW